MKKFLTEKLVADRKIAGRSTPTKAALVHWTDLPYRTVPQAAELLGCSPAKVYALAKDGRRIELVKNASTGRTMVTTASIQAVMGDVLPFAPGSSNPRGAALTRARARVASLDDA